MNSLSVARILLCAAFGFFLPLPVFNTEGLALLALFIAYGFVCHTQGQQRAHAAAEN